MSDNICFKVILAGKTGSGKSSLGNVLVGKTDAFKVGTDFLSETSEMKMFSGVLKGTTQQIEIVDTIGFGDNRSNNNIRLKSQGQMDFHNLSIEGFHLILYCIEAADRFDETDTQNLRDLIRIYQPEILDSLCIVITKMDRRYNEKDETKEKYEKALPEYFKKRNISLKLPMLFSEKELQADFIEQLQKIVSQAKRYQDAQQIKINNLQDFLDQQFGKENLKLSILECNEIENLYGNSQDLEDITFRDFNRERKIIYEIMDNQRGKDLKTIMESLKDETDFFKEISNFFLNKKIEKTGTLANLIFETLKAYNKDCQEECWSKSTYREQLVNKINEQIAVLCLNSLNEIINKHIRSHLKLDLDQQTQSLNTDMTGQVLLGSSLGLASTLAWVGGSKIATTGTTALLLGSEAAFAAITLATGLIGGIVIGVLSGLMSNYVLWSKEGVSGDVTREFLKKFLQSEGSKKFVIGVLIHYHDQISQ